MICAGLDIVVFSSTDRHFLNFPHLWFDYLTLILENSWPLLLLLIFPSFWGYNSRLVSSDGKEFTCNAGDPGSTLSCEDPLEKGMATHSSILAWRVPMGRGAWQVTVHGVAKSQTRLSD